MRIAIFDGILETHVGSSLERAFARRGHEVLNTGKIGHGFEFPSAGADLSHLQHAVTRVLDHAPDWIIVMRPASAPPRLLKRLRSQGAKVAVWLSDDPVLFHLSYGPVVESYDLVLHCGTANVLQHYEDFFGRPTGVNFPFWTDHEAFPYVWGSETAESTAIFLGNVHDQVRRKRYFSLGRMDTDVRVHGSIGTDYLGLGAGYLDSDAEVVNAGARARVAINIPQFFADHRGLPTWFPGLDQLGFFEYPSRVVQYLAMGLPVVSIIPHKHHFESLPEMHVAGDVAEADKIVAELLADDVEALSVASEQRFAKHFSADARVLAFEALVADDSWRRLDAGDRNLWFTQFDGREARPSEDTVTAPRIEVSNRWRAERVLVLGADPHRATSRAAVTARAMAKLGAHVVVADAAEAAGSHPELTGLVVCGANAARSVPSSIPQSAWRIIIDDTSHTVKDMAGFLSSFDAVGVRDAKLHAQLVNAGHGRVAFCPPAVDAHFIDLLQELDGDSAPLVRTTASLDVDAAFAPALNSDVVGSMEIAQNYEELSRLSLEELARRCRARIGLLGFSGKPADPIINDVTPFVAAAVDVVVVARVVPESLIAPYSSFALQVRERGELATKLRRLADSPSLRDKYSSAHLRRALDAEASLQRLVSLASRERAEKDSYGYPRGLSHVGMVSASFPVPAVEGGAAQRVINLDVNVRDGRHAEHVVEILEGDWVIHAEQARPIMSFVVLAQSGRALAPLAVRLRFVGEGSIAPAEDLVSVRLSVSRFAETVTAVGALPPETSVWRRI